MNIPKQASKHKLMIKFPPPHQKYCNIPKQVSKHKTN